MTKELLRSLAHAIGVLNVVLAIVCAVAGMYGYMVADLLAAAGCFTARYVFLRERGPVRERAA